MFPVEVLYLIDFFVMLLSLIHILTAPCFYPNLIANSLESLLFVYNGEYYSFPFDNYNDMPLKQMDVGHYSLLDLMVLKPMAKEGVNSCGFLSSFIPVSYTHLLGEVANPGRFNIDKDRLTLLDALSMAGDLTVYGKRENVLVQREENGKKTLHQVNLNSGYDLYASPVYYLQQNDIVYVEPNSMKARQATVNGNNVRSASFWMSLALSLIHI